MAKRSSYDWNSDVEESEEFTSIEMDVEVATVRLVLLKTVTLKITGQITGKEYVFSGAGSVVDVDKRDADIMLNKYGGPCDCPSSVGRTPYFEIAR